MTKRCIGSYADLWITEEWITLKWFTDSYDAPMDWTPEGNLRHDEKRHWLRSLIRWILVILKRFTYLFDTLDKKKVFCFFCHGQNVFWTISIFWMLISFITKRFTDSNDTLKWISISIWRQKTVHWIKEWLTEQATQMKDSLNESLTLQMRVDWMKDLLIQLGQDLGQDLKWRSLTQIQHKSQSWQKDSPIT